MKKLILMLFCFALQPVLAQVEPSSLKLGSNPIAKPTIEKEGLTEIELKEAKTMYRQMMQTPAYLAAEEARQKFREKANQIEVHEDLEEFRQWMTWNLSSTKFESADEAVQMFQRYLDLYAIQANENKVLYDYIARALAKQLMVIFQAEFSRARGQASKD